MTPRISARSKQLTVPVNGTIFAGVVEGFAIKIKFDGAIGGFAPADSGRAFNNPRLHAGIINVFGEAPAPRSLADGASVDRVAFRRDSRPSDMNADVAPAANRDVAVTSAVHHVRMVTQDLYPVFAPIIVDAMLV